MVLDFLSRKLTACCVKETAVQIGVRIGGCKKTTRYKKTPTNGKPDASPEARRSFLFPMLTTSPTKTITVVVEILLVIRVEWQLGRLRRNKILIFYCRFFQGREEVGLAEEDSDFNFLFQMFLLIFLG